MGWSILGECARIAREGSLAALASVVRRRGSLPMSATAKLLVTAGGARYGTVGGGCLEGEIVERAHDVMQTRMPSLSRHALNATMAGDYGLTCGGVATVFIEPVFGDEVLIAVYDAASSLLARGEPGATVTATNWRREIRKGVIDSRGAVGNVPSPTIALARERYREAESPLLLRGYVLDPIDPAPPLLVFGGGHVGAAIARAATAAGWRVTVIDDREEFADRARHPTAERTVVADYHDIGAVVPLTPATYAVVATRGHQHDALVVDQLARHELRYLGMLGSRRKVALTWRLLESWGVPAARLATVHAPVGMPIGADTPEEIAVSVVAEMIAVRRRGSRRRGGVLVSSAEPGTSPDNT